MKIVILDKYKITNFNLPEKAEDSFLVPYMDKFITIEANEGKWQLKSNGDANAIVNSSLVGCVDLTYYKNYELKILGEDELVTLYALPLKEVASYNVSVVGASSITIGNKQGLNICYNNKDTAEIHAEIQYINNEWYIACNNDQNYKTYINGKRVMTAKISCGDVIFINGLKIIWMNSFFKINNPNNALTVYGLGAYNDNENIDNSQYAPVSNEEQSVTLYTEDDYFYHTPRITRVVEEKNISVDAPPGSPLTEDVPFLLSIGSSLTMMASSGVMLYNTITKVSSGQQTVKQALPQLILTGAMLFGSLVMPRVLKAYNKSRAKRKEKKRQEKYGQYIKDIEKEIEDALKEQGDILKDNNLSFKQCYELIVGNVNQRKIWEREITDDDFLRVRLGSGNIDSMIDVSAPEEHFSLDTDNLQELAFGVKDKAKYISNAPITLNIAEQTMLALIFNCPYQNDYVNGLLVQLLAMHSPDDLKIVIFTNEANKDKWNYMKFVPHCFSETKEERFFATNLEEYKEISTFLEEELKNRKEVFGKEDQFEKVDSSEGKTYTKFSPYYLIISDDYKLLKNTAILEILQKTTTHLGFTLLTISNNFKNLPSKCEKFIEIGEKNGCILDKNLSSKSQTVFTNEFEPNLNMAAVSAKLSNIPVLTKEGLSVLPQSLSFLEMFDVSKIEQLNILNRWHTNNPVKSLSTTIGVHANREKFYLDLHEKFHGPHGLIAGSTGSGKSEFIITYILSMALNYSPYEVQFVLIDYKGGGLAGAFENKETGVKIPHLVGTITNLDTAEMNRTLVSISSELKRRQRKFNEVKDKLNESTIDIYKYQKFYREGLIDEPMAHLFIISDEFAELKSQQPEFLQELVSTARIGRSLGVHLILATQKPTGVVNDQIWSNSKFKVCLKVQDRSDSMEMLKKPDAASIKDPGRFYLQVGYDDYYDIGQSGWGGAKYVPSDKIIKKVNDSIDFINNVGSITKSINDVVKVEQTADMGEQLTNLVRYIYNLAVKENIVTRKMWLDKIPDKIYISNLKQKYNYKPTPYFINPVIGEYDNPAAQEQGILNLNLNDNTLIYGQNGSGKENLLSTIIWSSMTEHYPEEVNFYIIDCGAETLKMFYKIPHVGEVITVDENEKISDCFSMLADEIDARKDKYADYAGSYINYCTNSGKKDPLIVTVINSYEIFSETYVKLADKIQTLYRDGVKYGITFVITCTMPNSLRGRASQSFANKIALQLPNKDDYRSIIPTLPKGLMPSKAFGRGVISKDDTGYEFQTAYIGEKNDISNIVREATEKLNQAYKNRAKKIPTVPSVVTVDKFSSVASRLDSVPIGFDTDKKAEIRYNFTKNKINSIVSETMPSRIGFTKVLINQIMNISNINLKIVDFVNIYKDDFPNVSKYASEYDKAIDVIYNEVKNETQLSTINCYVFVGIGEFESELSPAGQKKLEEIFMMTNALKKSYFIFIDNYSSYKKLQVVDWYRLQVDKSNGIWLGPNLANQMAFEVSNISMEVRRLDFPDIGFVIENNDFVVMKYMVEGDMNGK